MPGAPIAKKIDSFVAAGHVPDRTYLRCSRCGTTLYDFLKRGKLPCLNPKP